jgi:branched-chain amino acid transport system substrate-binding protein
MSKTIRIAAILAIALACSRAQARESNGAESRALVIGATLPLTGAEAKAGMAFKEGYELAIEEANRAGGVLLRSGRLPVSLKIVDDGSSAEQAIRLAQRLIDVDKAQLLLGTYSTSLVLAQSAVPEEAHVPYVNGGGAASEIYRRTPKYVFGLLAPVDLLAFSEMRWIELQQSEGRLPMPLRIAILWENTPHGKDFRSGVLEFATKTARRKGSYEVVLDESFEMNYPDAKRIMARLKAAKADVFLADAHLPDYIALHKEYVAQKLCHAVVSYGARGSERQAAEALGRENVAYILSAVWWNAAAGPGKPFADAFMAKHQRAPEWYHALAYESARALLTAVQNAGSADRERVREQLDKLQMDSILVGGRLWFQDHQAHYPFVVQQNRPDGTSPIVYPRELAQAPGVAPNPRCSGEAVAQHSRD